jgi:hypothetical protein
VRDLPRGRAAVVGREDDERVVAKPFSLERLENLSDRFIHGRQHARVGAARFLQFVVGLLVRLGHLMWGVDGIERDVEEEPPIARLGVDELHCFLCQQLRAVAFVVAGAILAVPVVSAVPLVGEVVDLSVVKAVLNVEPAPRRELGGFEVSQVPLAHDGGSVSRFLECLRDRALFERQPVLRPGTDDPDLQAMPHRITPGHQRGPRRGTHRLHVKVLEVRARGGQPVHLRSRDVASAGEANVGVAEIIREDEDDVRTRRFAL